MLENFLQHRATIEHLRGGLLGPHLDSFVAALSELGYAAETVQKRLRLLDALGQWLRRQGLLPAHLHEVVVNLFLEERRGSGRLPYGDAQAVRDFLDHLRGQGVVRTPEPVADSSPLATLGRRYEDYLKKEAGFHR